MANIRETRIPRDTDFRQQRIKVWRPLCTGNKLTACFITTGIIFVAIGVFLVWDAGTVVQVSVDYDNQCCVANCSGSGERRDLNPCFVNITVDEEMDGPIYVFYELTSFYQNNRLVVNSRDDAQLKGFTRLPNQLECRNDEKFAVDGRVKDDFTQEFSTDYDIQSNVISPCGLLAHGFFNDSIEIGTGTSSADYSPLPGQHTDDITWSSEDGTGWPNEKQYKNAADGSTGNNYDGFAEWKQRACSEKRDLHTTIAEPDRLGDFANLDAWVSGCQAAQVDANHSWDGVSDDFPSTPGWCFPGSGYCIEDPHFIVWMRTSALVPFRKMYAKLDENNWKLPKGTYLAKIWSGQLVHDPSVCNPNDPLGDCYFRARALNLSESKKLTAETLYSSSTAAELDAAQRTAFTALREQWQPEQQLFPAYAIGTKRVVLSTSGRVGGKNYTLGAIYLVYGIVLVFAAAVFRLKVLWNNRPVGSASFIHKQD